MWKLPYLSHSFFFNYLILFLFFIEEQLIYNVTLVSGIEHSDLAFYKLYSINNYYRIMIIIPCVIHYISFMCSSLYLLIP